MHQKLDVARVFERIFDVYRDQATVLLPAALIVFLPVALFRGLVEGGEFGAPLFALVALILALVGNYWYQGVVVQAVRDIEDGVRDFSLGMLFRSVGSALVPLVAAGIVAGIGIGFGLVLLVIPGLLLLTWWALAAPVVVIERPGVLAALGRSRALVRGNAWRVFSIIIVLTLLQGILSGAIQSVVALISDNPATASGASLVASVIVAPLSALAATIVYLELRRLHGEPAVSGTGRTRVGGP